MSEITNEQHKTYQEAKEKFDGIKKDLSNDVDLLTSKKSDLIREVSDLDASKISLISQIRDLSTDLDEKSVSKRYILQDYDKKIELAADKHTQRLNKIDEAEKHLIDLEEDIKEIAEQVDQKQTEYNNLVTILDTDIEGKRTKVRKLAEEIKEYEEGMSITRDDDKVRSKDLLIREQSLQAKRRAFFEEKKTYLREKREFYSLRALTD